MSDVEEKKELSPTVKCLLCTQEYDRKDTEKYRPAGVFENWCLCEDCIHKYKTSGWGWHQ